MKLAWPIDKILVTQGFARSPSAYARFGMRGHNGIDLRTRYSDTPLAHRYVLAAAEGVVLEVNVTPMASGYGKFVRLRHEDGSQTIYAHLWKTYVVKGERVKQGQQVGVTGNTGYSTGPHLHFGYRPPNWADLYNNGFKGYIDPTPYLPKL